MSASGGRPIKIGYPWRLDLLFTAPDIDSLFPEGSTYAADLKELESRESALAQFSVTRIDDFSLRLTLDPSGTSALRPGTVYADVVRTDVEPNEYTYIKLRIAVEWPLTRAQ